MRRLGLRYAVDRSRALGIRLCEARLGACPAHDPIVIARSAATKQSRASDARTGRPGIAALLRASQ
jgi:hypothetical protein